MASANPVFEICAIARLLKGRRHVAVGANSPIPGTAALLAQALDRDGMRVSILGSHKHSSFTGLGDLFDCAALGRLDGFFLSPGQIDGQANINMVGIGSYPNFDVRWPGSHGSPLLYMMIPGIILFKEEHSTRSLVPKVAFISAPGVSAPNVYRPGGPGALVTSKACFAFDRQAARFRLETVHPGSTVEEVVANTGFAFDRPAAVAPTPPPDAEMVSLLRERVAAEIGALYPRFAKNLLASLT